MIVDEGSTRVTASEASASTASTSVHTSPGRIMKSPTKRINLMKHHESANRNQTRKPSNNRDITMTDIQATGGFNTQPASQVEMIEPLNLVSMSQLGEPDPTAISKHDLLSAMAFDRTGTILSVGDRGGRVICFQVQENDDKE